MNRNHPVADLLGVILHHQTSASHEASGKRVCSALSFRLQSERGQFRYKGKTFHLQKNDICFVPTDIRYRHQTTFEEIIVFHFHLLSPAGDDIRIFTPKNPEIYEPLFRRALRLWEEKEIGYYPRVMAIFYEILALLQEDGFLLSGEKSGLAATAAGLLEQNLSDPTFTVDRLAQELYTSPSNLRKKFREEFGISPLQYLIQCRIREAEILLSSRYFSQKQIAERCGFSDVKYFRNAFKAATGKTPRQYEKETKAP